MQQELDVVLVYLDDAYCVDGAINHPGPIYVSPIYVPYMW